MYTDAEYLAALKKVQTEFDARTGGKTNATFKETMDVRLYAKSQTNLRSDDLTAEQAAWKLMFNSLTETLWKADPETMKEVQCLEAQIEALEAVVEATQVKIEAHPHDYGFRVPWGFLIVGGLIGWLKDGTLWSVIVCAFAAWITGILFSIFVMKSANVQSVVAIKLNHIGLKRIAHWLYGRALSIE